MTRLRTLFTAAALVLAPAIALAQPSSPTAEPTTAEGWYKVGSDHYNLGEFDAAIDAFKKGFALESIQSKKAAYLYNIAQSYRVKKDCTNSVFFYKRFLEFKDQDTVKPLAADKRAEIQKWITEGEECVRTATATANSNPQTLEPTTKPTTPDPTTVATVTPDPEEVGGGDVHASTTYEQPTVISVRALGGVELPKAGDLDPGASYAVGLIAGYPLALGPQLTLELGVAGSASALSVGSNMGTSKDVGLYGVMANAGVTYAINAKLGIRGDLGLGALIMTGAAGTEVTGGADTTGALAMPHVRVGVSADYAITSNLVATLAPFSFAYSPAKDGLRADIKSITAIDIMLGVGYRM